jgi:hypothetical protein
MKPITLKLPKGTQSCGEILHDYSNAPERLGSDILQVTLPNGIVIDVSWRPAFDLHGRFEIRLFEGDWDNQLLKPIFKKSPVDAALLVEQLAALWQPDRVQPSSPTRDLFVELPAISNRPQFVGAA